MAPLMHASVRGHVGAMRVLLEAGAAVDSRDQNGIPALMLASAAGHENAVRVLLEAGAAVDSRDQNGMPALMLASQRGHENAARVLLEAGAAVDSRDKYEMAPLMHASVRGHVGAMRVLLEAGAAVDSRDQNGIPALMLASATGHENAVRVLLEAGAAVDSRDRNGTTALMRASAAGHENTVRVLLEAGAAVDLKDKHGMTALMYASEKGCEAAVLVLLKADADATLKDNNGVTARAHAHANGHGGARQALGLAAKAAAADALLEAAVAAEAAAAGGALLAEEEAEKLSAESRQAKAKRKKQRQKTKRAEAVPGPAQPAEGARGGPASSGETPPGHSPAGQAVAAAGAGDDEGQRAAAEEGPKGAEGSVSANAGRRASHASDGADWRGGAEPMERDAVGIAPLDDSPLVVTVPAEEVFRALEAAGSDGEVGEGGFGKAIAAELPSLAARWGRVTVKCASKQHAADILQEVATLRLCRHCNVLTLLGYCDDARAPCMVTPLMRGGSLDDRLLLSGGALERLRRLNFEGDAVLDWQQRLSALCDATRGLAHLHDERILHRDVKTANILLEGALRPLPMAHGPPLRVYRAVLSDVGLAKVREPTLGGTTTHATTRNLAISMGFVDPSLVNSNQHSERTDAFGIGICILMSLVSEPAAGLMYDHEEDVIEATEDGTARCLGRRTRSPAGRRTRPARWRQWCTGCRLHPGEGGSRWRRLWHTWRPCWERRVRRLVARRRWRSRCLRWLVQPPSCRDRSSRLAARRCRPCGRTRRTLRLRHSQRRGPAAS